jgi:PAS domain S-box-containing protein
MAELGAVAVSVRRKAYPLINRALPAGCRIILSRIINSRKRAADKLHREESIDRAYRDILTLINHDWFSIEDLTVAALAQINAHVPIIYGVCFLMKEEGLVPLSSMGVTLPSSVGQIVKNSLERNELIHLHSAPPDSLLSVSNSEKIIIPNEIIAVPLTVKNGVVAMLELASLHGFGETDLRIIDRIAAPLGSGINSIKSGLILMTLLEERNRIFNLSLDMISVSGFDCCFKVLNPAWEKNLGWSYNDLMAKPFLDLVHPDEREAAANASEQLRSGQHLVNFENRCLCRDGSYKWLSFNSYPLVEERLVFSIARDVTAQIIQQRETSETNRLLEKAVRVKSDFLANMSHELRTPLNAIIGFSEVLQDQLCGPINPKQLEYVNNIHISGKHLLTMINDILDLSRVESVNPELHPGVFSLRESLNETLNLLREKSDKNALSIQINLDPEADVRITADQKKFKQIMFNLVSNAIKFTPAGGAVDVSAHLTGTFIEISVADNGIGIKESEIGNLFQAFTQLESVYTREYQGAGLGLALTKQLVELHGGAIRVESLFGSGSRFSFTIPLRKL